MVLQDQHDPFVFALAAFLGKFAQTRTDDVKPVFNRRERIIGLGAVLDQVQQIGRCN